MLNLVKLAEYQTLFSIYSIQAQKFMEYFMDATDNVFGISTWLFKAYCFLVARLITELWRCICIHLSKRKEVNFEDKPVPSDLSVFGAGIRYLVARKFNIYSGIDVALGSEEGAYDIQFGHYWNSL